MTARASRAGIIVSHGVCEQLEAYFRLLTLWNQRINLTALPLSPPTDETFDRLLIEPLAAARFAAEPPQAWFDLGSGGGSPAIPFKIAHPSARLTMVESKTKKAAFLREAIRVLGLTDTVVIDERFETISDERSRQESGSGHGQGSQERSASLPRDSQATGAYWPAVPVSLSGSSTASPSDFTTDQVAQLGTAGDARLTILKPVFHVENKGVDRRLTLPYPPQLSFQQTGLLCNSARDACGQSTKRHL